LGNFSQEGYGDENGEPVDAELEELFHGHLPIGFDLKKVLYHIIIMRIIWQGPGKMKASNL